METQIFVNLPVKDLNKAIAFFTSLGYSFNQQFTDENATCMVISDTIYVMLLVEKYFQSFTNKSIPDTTKSSEVIVSLSLESREAVDEMVSKAVAAGATTPKAAVDHGFMYQYGYQDLDGHLWEVFYMNPQHVQPA